VLMTSLMHVKQSPHGKSVARRGRPDKDSNTLMMKVFLVFQEMKAAGAEPDLACFNALLRACARAGDFEHAQDVLRQIQAADLDPNDSSWRQLIQTAVEMRRSDLAQAFWKQGLLYRHRRQKVDEPQKRWKPSVASLATLATAYLREAEIAKGEHQANIYQQLVNLFDNLLLGDEKMGLDRVDIDEFLGSQRTMLLILQGIVASYELTDDAANKKKLLISATSILELDCFKELTSSRLSPAAKYALRKVRSLLGQR
jgi:pentatricopeptide repeat protein